ncbi:Hsp70 family protein [Actinomycetes bacterium KLBMP 9797]
MGGGGFRVGVDFGTSNTAAVLAFPDGRVRPLLFDGSPLLPSAVHADPEAGLLVGRDAMHAARARPDCFEPHPKRCVDDGTALLGEARVPVVDLIAAVLGRVAAEAARVAGGPVRRAVLTCPVGWGPRRQRVLRAAAAPVFAEVVLVAEPVAAATYFVAVAGRRLPSGASVMVYDLGAGTFDASVVRRTRDGFEVLATRGLADVGGLDIDAAIVGSLGETYGARDRDRWRRLAEPRDRADQRAVRTLWDDVRTGKELLSRAAHTTVHVPLFDDDAPVGREQLDRLARPLLARTVAASRAVLDAAGVAPADLAGLFLVGGSSRMPLAAALLHQGLGVAPTVVEQPELVVAEGSLHAAPLVAPHSSDAAPLVAPNSSDIVSDAASDAAPLVAPNSSDIVSDAASLVAPHSSDAASLVAPNPPEAAPEAASDAASVVPDPVGSWPPGPTDLFPGVPAAPRTRWRLPRRLAAAAVAVAVVAGAAAAVLVDQLPGSTSDASARVPEPLRAGCRDGGTEMPTASRTLRCRSPQGPDVVVGLFADQTAVDTAYQQAVRESGAARSEGDCTTTALGETTTALGEHRYPGAGAARGRVLCRGASGRASIVWTDDQADTVARAEVPAGDAIALRAAWLAWTSSPAFPTTEERALVDQLAATGCRRADIADLDDHPGATAGVRCEPQGTGARTVSYFRFGTVAALRAALDGLSAAVTAPTGVACEDGKAPGFLGSRRYDLRSAEVGVLLCHPGPQSTLVLRWSAEPLLLAGHATGVDAAELSVWWRVYSGPPVTRLVEAINAQSTPPFPTAPETALLDHVPPRSRKDCLRPSGEQVRTNVGTEPVVAVVCGPTSGARIVFYYQFPDRTAMRRSYGTGDAGEACTTLPRAFAGESRYQRGGHSGWLRCGTSESGNRWLEWTSEELAIQAFAFHGGDPTAMIDWWRHDAGPA